MFANRIQRILSRCSIMDLVEQTADNIAKAEQNLDSRPCRVTDAGETNLIRRFKVASDGKLYTVLRFETFCFCSCDGFNFRGTACRHIAATFPPMCAKCRERNVSHRGQMCSHCEAKAAPYLKPALNRTTTKIGNIRI